MVMLRACVAVCTGLLESATFTVKLAVPFGPVGVPVIAPVLALMLKPAGSAPAVIEKVSGAKPPVVATVWLYAVPSTSAGSEVVVIVGGGGRLIVMVNDLELVCGLTVLESFTCTVKVKVPAGPVAVPVKAPVELFKLKPAGKLPTVTE